MVIERIIQRNVNRIDLQKRKFSNRTFSSDQMAARPIPVRRNRRPIAMHAPSSSIAEIIPFKVRDVLIILKEYLMEILF